MNMICGGKGFQLIPGVFVSSYKKVVSRNKIKVNV